MKTKEERNPNFSKDLEDHKEAVIKVKTDATKAATYSVSVVAVDRKT